MPKEIQRGETRYIYQNTGKQTEKDYSCGGAYPIGIRTGARCSNVHSCCGLQVLLRGSGRHVDKVAEGRTIILVDAADARDIDR
jgi:hypothetical protein